MISLKHATLEDKRKSYEWLCLSDAVSSHMGAPDYPENPILTWDEFEEAFEDFYYIEEQKESGAIMIIKDGDEEIGCLCYACFHLQPERAELDIWLKSESVCGKGYGYKALKELIEYLRSTLNIKKFIIRPSEKNIRAVRSYEKAGFTRVTDKAATIKEYLKEEYLDEHGSGDYGYENTAVLTIEK